MKIHQQRVPIISPLDRDYHRRSSAPDELGPSINSFPSFKDLMPDSAKVDHQNPDKNLLPFTIVGERDL